MVLLLKLALTAALFCGVLLGNTSTSSSSSLCAPLQCKAKEPCMLRSVACAGGSCTNFAYCARDRFEQQIGPSTCERVQCDIGYTCTKAYEFLYGQNYQVSTCEQGNTTNYYGRAGPRQKPRTQSDAIEKLKETMEESLFKYIYKDLDIFNVPVEAAIYENNMTRILNHFKTYNLTVNDKEMLDKLFSFLMMAIPNRIQYVCVCTPYFMTRLPTPTTTPPPDFNSSSTSTSKDKEVIVQDRRWYPPSCTNNACKAPYLNNSQVQEETP